jgi:ADP-ribose pyrophosphatase
MNDKSLWQPIGQQDAVTIEEKKLLHDGFYKVLSYKLKHKKFNGTYSADINREQVFSKDAAAAILYDPIKDKLVLVEQCRIGVLEHRNDSPWLLEIVAGLIEPGEDPVNTIKREAFEETGCNIKFLHPIMSFYNSPGGFAEKTWAYCGIVDSDECHLHGGMIDEDEDILIHKLDAKKVLAEYQKWLTSSSTMLALQWFSMHYHHKDWMSVISEK